MGKKEDRRKREREERKRLILSSARVVFAEKGLSAASVDEIAERAELSKGTIYYYFGDKEKLFFSLLENGLDNLFNFHKDVVKNCDSPVEKVRIIIEKTLAYFDENRDFFRIFTPERGGLTSKRHPEIKKRILPRWRRITESVSRIMEEGIKSGELKNMDPMKLTRALFGLIHMSVARWVIEGRKTSLGKDTRVITTIFLDGAMRRQGTGR